MAFHPVPYYIIAFILLLIFGYLWPVLPISGGAAQNIVPQASPPTYIGSVLLHSILPALSIILVGIGGWFLGMRALVSNIVTEDYVIYAELAGVSKRRILPFYVMRNALVPQITGLAMSLGAIFNGAIIVEQVFSYPGLGRLLIGAVYSADYSLVLGVTAISIIAVAGVGLPDRHPLSAVRPADAAGMTFLAVLRDLLRYNPQFAVGAVLTAGRRRAWPRCRPSRPTIRSTPMSCRSTRRPPGSIRSAPPRAGRTSSGS